MKTAAQLLNEFLTLAHNPKEAAALFAEDGVVELPYLADLGMQSQYKGLAEIESLYALLLQLVPEWEFRDAVVLIDTPERAFAEYKVDALAVTTQRPFKQHFFGYIHVENGKIKLLREALNIVATARAFFPNGLADIAQPEAQEKMHIDGGPIGIAVLDDYQHAALSLADWSSLKPWASITIFHDHLAEADAVVARLKPFAVVCVMRERTPLTRDILQRLPSLKLIASTAPRNASIDTDTADRQGIKVAHTGYTSTPTVELTWALILGSARHIASEGESLRRGGWQQSVGDDLSGKTLAVLGLGNVGREVARIGLAFGMNVIAWSENLTPERAAAAGAELVSKEALFKQADFLSVHLVLSQRTRGLVGAEELSLMKSTARLINTSRAPIVTESDLVEVLRARKIAGAAIDVFDQEPLTPNHPFRTMTNVLATPHIGYVSRGLYETFYRDTVANIRRWIEQSSIRERNQ
ncbi:NAD(P)-dependent oxidoreductase [Caballeronia sp. SEWSISQ10-4 2]|uniref:NAD(P)-dependent oxidoreductase n=1 Tax=Caballeronia sp. SEWSISQ10-4 2 TaxID=2937438 RepID=UPI0034635D8B